MAFLVMHVLSVGLCFSLPKQLEEGLPDGDLRVVVTVVSSFSWVTGVVLGVAELQLLLTTEE